MKKITITFVLTAVISLTSFAGGGWLSGKGNGFFKLSESVIRGNKFYSGDGSLQNITTAGVHLTTLYGEYGISNKFDVIANFPVFARLTLNDVRFSTGEFLEGDSFNGIGDLDIGIKYGIRQNKSLVISTSLILGIPTGNTSGGRTELLQTGDGEFNQLLRVDFGYAFIKPFYSNVGFGFNNRTEGFSEEFRYDFELGYKHSDQLIIAFKLAGNESFNNGNPDGSSGNGIFSNNLEYLAFGPEISYITKKNWGITASYRTAAKGQFIIAAPAYEFGFFYKLN